MKFTEEELKRRYENLNNAIAHQRLEGYEPSVESIKDMERVVKGEITVEESITNIKNKIRNGRQ